MVCRRLLSGPIASCGDEVARWYISMSSELRREYLAALGLETWGVRGKSPGALETPPADARGLREAPREVAAPRNALATGEVPASRDVAAAREAGVDWPELRARV